MFGVSDVTSTSPCSNLRPHPMSTTAARPQTVAQPSIQTPPVLFERTQKVVAQIQAALGKPLITYWNSESGEICENDVIGLYGILRTVGKVDHLYLFVKSDGGRGQASLRMVNLPANLRGGSLCWYCWSANRLQQCWLLARIRFSWVPWRTCQL